MKVCFKCGVEKPINEFYKHPQMADGHLGKCKECAKLDAKIRRVNNLESVREYDKNRSRTEKFKNRSRIHQNNWRAKNKEKYVAHYLLHNAVRDKRIVRPDKCEICGKDCVPHGHHADHAKPLEVVWLCAECHGQIE